MNDMPKPTLLSRILSRLSKRLGQPYYTYVFRLPLPCCDWCKSQNEIAEREKRELDNRIAQLEQRIAILEEGAEFGQSSEAFKLKMEAALTIFDHATTAFLKQEYIITSPVEITHAFEAAFDVVDKLVKTHKRGPSGVNGDESSEHSMRDALVARSTLARNGHKPHAETQGSVRMGID